MPEHDTQGNQPSKPDKPDHEITFYVDNEALKTTEKEMTVRGILSLAGNTPPENFYLLEYRGEHEQARHDSMEEIIKLHNNLRFAAVYRGETPVWSWRYATMIGYERLIADFQASGYEVEGPFDSGGHKWVIINAFPVVGGRFVGNTVRVAVAVPGDYPTTPPGGLYVSPCIVPGDQMAGLNVHDRQNETGQLAGQWQYWSRPLPGGTWPGTHATKRLVTHWNAVFINVAA